MGWTAGHIQGYDRDVEEFIMAGNIYFVLNVILLSKYFVICFTYDIL